MARNVGIKARISSIEALLPKIIALSSEGPSEIQQDDTFFQRESGRLKRADLIQTNPALATSDLSDSELRAKRAIGIAGCLARPFGGGDVLPVTNRRVHL